MSTEPIKFLPGLEEQHIVVGGSDQVRCEAEGIPQPSFMWHVNGSAVKGFILFIYFLNTNRLEILFVEFNHHHSR